MTDAPMMTGVNAAGDNAHQSDSGGARSEMPSGQQAADRVDSYGKDDSDSLGSSGSASSQESADKLEQFGKGGASDFVESSHPQSSDSPGGGGSAPSGTGASYHNISEPYSTLPRSGGGSGEPESKLRMPSGPPLGGEEPKKKPQIIGNQQQ